MNMGIQIYGILYKESMYRNTGIQGYRDTGIQGYRDTGIQGYRDTGI